MPVGREMFQLFFFGAEEHIIGKQIAPWVVVYYTNVEPVA